MIDLQVINDNVWVFLSHSHNDNDLLLILTQSLMKGETLSVQHGLLNEHKHYRDVILRKSSMRY